MQGSEWYALCGARSLLDASPDVAFLLELWSYALRGATARQLLTYLAGLGFALGGKYSARGLTWADALSSVC
jgi:hypothetical protein